MLLAINLNLVIFVPVGHLCKSTVVYVCFLRLATERVIICISSIRTLSGSVLVYMCHCSVWLCLGLSDHQQQRGGPEHAGV